MSFQQGLSGLNATSKQLDVIGNNIANANTYGAKASRAEFADAYAASLSGGGSNPVGIGTTLAAVSQQFTQGNITPTQNPMDLAINGGGFFKMENVNGTESYTRNGQFKIDKDGYIVNNAQNRLMGVNATVGGIQGGIGPIKLQTGVLQGQATGAVILGGTMDSESAVTRPAAAPFLSASNADTYNRATSQTLYDAKGQKIAAVYYFQKTGPNTWDVYMSANGSFFPDPNVDPVPITTLAFDPDGGDLVPPIPAVPVSIPADPSPDQKWRQVDLTVDFSNIKEFGGLSGINDLRQDGYEGGQLTGIAIENTGVIMARYSNGQTQPAGQIELVNFRNPQGLRPLGGNEWAETNASGQATPGNPGDDGLGVLQAGALEESNIDLTGELVNMITAQRVYQANAQTIKTQDQVLQTLVNLR